MNPLNFSKTQRGQNTPKLILEFSVTLISKPNKDTTRKPHDNVPDVYGGKLFQQNTSKPSQQHIKRINIIIKWDLFLGYNDGSTQLNKCDTPH